MSCSKKDVAKKGVYDELVKKVKTVNASKLVQKKRL